MSIVLPAVLATTVITGRSLTAKEPSMPRPYQYGSVGVIYALAGLVHAGSPQLGTAIAWGYLVALLLVPTSGQFLQTVAGGLARPGAAPKGSAGTIPTA